jgi:capsular exopolysaccharide synthesis family protein
VTIRTEEDIAQFCRYPVLSSVPDMYAVGKGDHGRKRKTAFAGAIETKVFGSDISFAASEAYKLLRTKLQFSFAGENNCRVICVSSSLSGEGKSLSSINLAYTLAQMNKKVMLIDCDMRRPTIAEKLKIQRKPGLSDYLSGQSALTGLIQHYSIKGSENVFSVITAGQNPPNPIELLASERMANMLQKMRQVYDYVILDLPPVGEVSDAMAVAKETDGVLLVVRNNYCSRMALNDTVQQFEFIGAKILGIVCNCATESVGQYGKYGKYGKYGEEKMNAAEKEKPVG